MSHVIKHSLKCDEVGCSAEIPFEETQFKGMVRETRAKAKELGWTFNRGSRWALYDFCPEHRKND